MRIDTYAVGTEVALVRAITSARAAVAANAIRAGNKILLKPKGI